MADPQPVARQPNMTLYGAWSNGNNMYGLMATPDRKAQIVVARPGMQPQFYNADISQYDHRSGGTIKTDLGTFNSTGGFMPRVDLTTPTGDVLKLETGSYVKQNLERTINGAAPTPQPR